jgi:exodeoxyribonuclease-3
MIIYSWNVNGLRAASRKGLWDWAGSRKMDVLMLQETKAHPEQLTKSEAGPEDVGAWWNWSKKKKGYSGTAVFSRIDPLNVSLGLPEERYQGEGRLVHLEFEDFHLFNVYFPNGQMSQERLDYKLGYYDAFLEHAETLRKDKPILVGGDFNTAHTEIDLKNPKANADTSGFLPIEREWLDKFIAHGYVDLFRRFEPEGGHYTWWTYRYNARSRNAGWRIDYFFASEELADRVRRMWHETEVLGSDHCPIGVELA